MKTIFITIIAVFAIVASSCNQRHEENKMEVLTSHAWKVTQQYMRIDNDSCNWIDCSHASIEFKNDGTGYFIREEYSSQFTWEYSYNMPKTNEQWNKVHTNELPHSDIGYIIVKHVFMDSTITDYHSILKLNKNELQLSYFIHARY